MRDTLKYSVLKVSLYLHSQIKGSHKGLNSLRCNSFKHVEDKENMASGLLSSVPYHHSISPLLEIYPSLSIEIISC